MERMKTRRTDEKLIWEILKHLRNQVTDSAPFQQNEKDVRCRTTRTSTVETLEDSTFIG